MSVPSKVSFTLSPTAMDSSSVSMTIGRPMMSPDGSFMVSTTPLYASSLRKPVSGERPPLQSSCTSHDWRSVIAMVLVAEAATAALSAANRLIRVPPWGTCFAAISICMARAAVLAGMAWPAWKALALATRDAATTVLYSMIEGTAMSTQAQRSRCQRQHRVGLGHAEEGYG